MARAASRRKRKRSVLAPILLSAAAGSLVTLALIYTPEVVGSEIADLPSRVFRLESPAPAPDTVTIRVLNGAGVSDLASRAQTFLETRRGGVVLVAPEPPGNAERMNYAMTVVLAHDTCFSAALTVAGHLGLGDSSVVMLLPAQGEQAMVDVTVILGRDRNDPAFFIPYRD